MGVPGVETGRGTRKGGQNGMAGGVARNGGQEWRTGMVCLAWEGQEWSAGGRGTDGDGGDAEEDPVADRCVRRGVRVRCGCDGGRCL